ncbi:MAG: prephenate dehydratase [Frankiales bacterium]|nr:prephenate dehydratase [Frankiales bacterium]
MTIAYLGPRGTFTEEALRSMPVSADADLRPLPSASSVLDAVRDGDVDLALVAIENSVEGGVTGTLDELAAGEPLVIVDEVVLRVRFALMARPGTDLASVRRVATHPVAAAQCRAWVAAHLPGAEVLPEASNAAGAAAVAAGTYDAAIAPALAADVYGLEVLAADVGDNDEAWTRFVLLARPGALPAPTGADKTTLYLFMREDHPGALMEILTEFSVRGVNLTRIESRPTRKALGDYYFSVDCEGHVADARVGEALAGLHRVCAHVRFLGSYPRHDGKAPLVRPGVTDDDYAEALAWLASIRGRA